MCHVRYVGCRSAGRVDSTTVNEVSICGPASCAVSVPRLRVVLRDLSGERETKIYMLVPSRGRRSGASQDNVELVTRTALCPHRPQRHTSGVGAETTPVGQRTRIYASAAGPGVDRREYRTSGAHGKKLRMPNRSTHPVCVCLSFRRPRIHVLWKPRK